MELFALYKYRAKRMRVAGRWVTIIKSHRDICINAIVIIIHAK